RLVLLMSRPALRYLVFAVLITPFAWDLSIDKAAVVSDPISGAPASHAMVDATAHDNMMTNVDVPSSLIDPKYLALNSLLSTSGSDTTYIALRESSISSIFMTPLRNALSAKSEAWGIDTFLGMDADFLSQHITAQLDRAAYMGISHFASFSPTL